MPPTKEPLPERQRLPDLCPGGRPGCPVSSKARSLATVIGGDTAGLRQCDQGAGGHGGGEHPGVAGSPASRAVTRGIAVAGAGIATTTATQTPGRGRVAHRRQLRRTEEHATNAHHMSFDVGSSMQRPTPVRTTARSGVQPRLNAGSQTALLPCTRRGIPARGKAAGKGPGNESRQRGYGQVPCGRP